MIQDGHRGPQATHTHLTLVCKRGCVIKAYLSQQANTLYSLSLMKAEEELEGDKRKMKKL